MHDFRQDKYGKLQGTNYTEYKQERYLVEMTGI